MAGFRGKEPTEEELEYMRSSLTQIIVDPEPVHFLPWVEYQPIHNRYYAIWIIGTTIAIWIVHYYHL